MPSCWGCFDRSSIPAWIVDVDTLQFKAANDAALALFGYSRAELLALRLTDVSPPDMAATLRPRAAHRRIGETLLPVHARRHFRKDGSIVQVEITAIPFEGPGQRLDLELAHEDVRAVVDGN